MQLFVRFAIFSLLGLNFDASTIKSRLLCGLNIPRYLNETNHHRIHWERGQYSLNETDSLKRLIMLVTQCDCGARLTNGINRRLVRTKPIMRRGKFNFQNTIINDGMYYDAPLIQSTETLALYAFKVTESNAAVSRNLCGGVCVLQMGAQRACTQTTPRKLSVCTALLEYFFQCPHAAQV